MCENTLVVGWHRQTRWVRPKSLRLAPCTLCKRVAAARPKALPMANSRTAGKLRGCGRNTVAAYSRVPTALLSSLTGLVLSLAPVYPAINRWAIVSRPPDFDCRPAGTRGCASSSSRASVVLRAWVAASVLSRQPHPSAGAIDNSPPFQRWVPAANAIRKPRRGDRRRATGGVLPSGAVGIRHRMPDAPMSAGRRFAR